MNLFETVTKWLGFTSNHNVEIQHESCKLCGDEFDKTEENIKKIETKNDVKDNNNNNNNNNNTNDNTKIYAYMHSEQALNRRELGRASWAYLHTLTNYYPENPSISHQKEMVELIWLYMKYYPCGYCSDMTIQEMYRNPPKVSSRKEFSHWMCQIHNEVNERMGKPIFDCNKTSKRWRT